MPLSFSEKVLSSRSRSSSLPTKVQGIVISDTHRFAPYSDFTNPDNVFQNSEDIFERSLANPNVKFCVLNGDIEEVVNLKVKSLPVTVQAQGKLRIGLVEDYALKKGVVLSKDTLQKIPSMENSELKDILCDIHEKGCEMAFNHPPQLGGKRADNLFDKENAPEKKLKEIISKTTLRDDRINEIVAQHLDHLTYLVNRYPHVTFHYVIGNHERMDFFIDSVNTLRKDLKEKYGEERLKIYEDYVKIGDGLFVHGDQQMSPEKYVSTGPDKFKEANVELNRSIGLQLIEDQGNKIVPSAVLADSIHAPGECALNIMRWFHKNSPETLNGIKHIFSGHTHTPYTNVMFIYPSGGKKYIFHNTGAALSRFQELNKDTFNPLFITLDINPSHAGEAVDTDHAYYRNARISNVTPLKQMAHAYAI